MRRDEASDGGFFLRLPRLLGCRPGGKAADAAGWSQFDSRAVCGVLEPPQAAIEFVRARAKVEHEEAWHRLCEKAHRNGITPGQVKNVLEWVRDRAPLIIHVDLDRFCEREGACGGFYRSRFEVAADGSECYLDKRSRWEQKLFDGHYDLAEPFQRPKYGVIDVMNDFRGCVWSSQQYGDSYLVMDRARVWRRCSHTNGDSSEARAAATLDMCAHVLLDYGDADLRELARIAGGRRLQPGDSMKIEGYRYKELQIHGELNLRKDVSKLVVASRHRGGGQERIRRLCDKYGWEFVWMDDERARR